MNSWAHTILLVLSLPRSWDYKGRHCTGFFPSPLKLLSRFIHISIRLNTVDVFNVNKLLRARCAGSTCNLSTQRLRQEDCKFEVSLGHIGNPCLKNK
jgi:hypothetical protein